jgi:predicted acyltransferase
MKPARLTSLDAFRGLTMAGMVIVNNPGDGEHVYAPLRHAQWNGCTPTDLIFPFFLFIVGVSITLSRGTMGDPWRIVKRALVIFGLGLLLTLYPRFDFSIVRVPGVLQRIAVCYLAAAFLFRWTAVPRGTDDARRWMQGRTLMLWAAGLTLAYWAIMILVPVPGVAMGSHLTPGNDLGAYLDRHIFGNHLYSQTKTWDPEGLLSTVPALATTLLGGVAGLWLGSRASGGKKAMWLVGAGLAAMAVGLLWGLAFPINKKIWTSSYVWFTGGAAAVFLAMCYALIDVRGWKAWSRPFVILGLNAIALYTLSGLLSKFLSSHRIAGADGQSISWSRHLYGTWFVPLASPINASLLWAFAHLAILFVILWVMDKRGIYLKA